MLNKNIIEKIAKQDNERYGGRLEKLGPVIRTLGWDTKENQWKRFAGGVELLDLTGKSIVDIGCGLGDFFEFLKEKNIKIASYTGIDISEGLISAAQKKHPDGAFECRNILLTHSKTKLADVGFAFGVFNFNFKEKPNNYEYAQDFIKNAYSLCKEALVVDMLSDCIFGDYPKEDFVFYYKPEKILKFALTLTDNVILRHDSQPIPQKEFILILKRHS